jgi:hypothetical protein
MSIIRAPRKESNFYVLDKKISEDKRLSWAARGLLVFLLGKPDHWSVNVQALVNETAGSRKQTGRDGVYGLLKELIDVGYVARQQERNNVGVLGETHYVVSEVPLTQELPVLPLPGLPYTAQPLTANPTLVSIEGEARTESEQGLKGERVSAPCAQAPTFPPLDEPVVPVVKNPAPVAVAMEAVKAAAPQPTAKPKAATATTKTPATKTAVAAVACPSDVPAEVFADFLTIRKAKRAPLTATALGGIRREADKAGVTLEQALIACCERGWVGFRADWYHEGSTAPAGARMGGNGGKPNPNKQEALEARNRAVAAQWVADMQAKMNAQGGVL